MSARGGEGMIGTSSVRGIAWYMFRSAPMAVALSSYLFESRCTGNKSTKVWIILQPAIRETELDGIGLEASAWL